MKRAALAALTLMLAAGALLIWGLVGTRLDMTAHSPLTLPAEDHAAEFERLKKAAAAGSLIGTVYSSDSLGGAENYELIIYTVTLRNRGLLPAVMAEVNVSPADNDVLCYTDGSASGEIPDITVPAGGSRDIRCVLLSRRVARQSAVRNLYVSYYIWGNPFTVRVTAGM